MPEDTAPVAKSAESSLTRLATLVGIASTVLSVMLTIYNARLKSSLDQAEARMKERSTEIEESKERVARYGWVRTLFPDLTDADPKKRAFTLSVMRLALSDSEAEQLFAGLSGSSDENLKEAGRAGLSSIQDQEVSKLIASINAQTADERKAGVARLIAKYSRSPVAISMGLDMLTEHNLPSISPSGVINVLYFLAATDPAVWSGAQKQDGDSAVKRLQANSPGPQTVQAINQLQATLKKVGGSAQ